MSENPVDQVLPENKLIADETARSYIMIDLTRLPDSDDEYAVAVATQGIDEDSMLTVLEGLVATIRAEKANG